MTAACREPCCAPPRLSVGELFERGFRRIRESPLAIRGPKHTDAEANAASFSLAISGDRLYAIRFQASPCATLLAYCELIAETLPGRRLDIAQALTAAELIQQLPGVPLQKQTRAVLAVAALRAALAAAALNSSSCHSGESHESRLHFRHLAP